MPTPTPRRQLPDFLSQWWFWVCVTVLILFLFVPSKPDTEYLPCPSVDSSETTTERTP
jgi:hypothetical protein